MQIICNLQQFEKFQEEQKSNMIHEHPLVVRYG